MEIFYSDKVDGGFLTLTQDDSQHCARVLRHRRGENINVIDGAGTLYRCTITDDNPRAVQARIDSSQAGWHAVGYHLTMAVCPTKNNDRFEWFVEKAVEVGVDRIQPVIGEHSERKVYKSDRALRIALSAAKQSLKAAVPQIGDPVSVDDFIKSCDAGKKFIAYCFEDREHPRISLAEALEGTSASEEIAILIGPEGDFSTTEAARAIAEGFVPVHLGTSRLRTETAALTATIQVYTHFL